jgi:hypothetical protein
MRHWDKGQSRIAPLEDASRAFDGAMFAAFGLEPDEVSHLIALQKGLHDAIMQGNKSLAEKQFAAMETLMARARE